MPKIIVEIDKYGFIYDLFAASGNHAFFNIIRCMQIMISCSFARQLCLDCYLIALQYLVWFLKVGCGTFGLLQLSYPAYPGEVPCGERVRIRTALASLAQL